jgi:DNA-binding NtrC family response regulator
VHWFPGTGEPQNKEEQMIQNMTMPTIHDAPGSEERQSDSYLFARPRRARRFSRKVVSLCALVVSSDEVVQQNLANIIAKCGLVVFRAFTVGESRRILNCQQICLVVCDDRLIDGKYEDLLKATETSRTKAPVIVVSLAGDWPDYFKAMSAGVFDFLAYPPIPGELPRVVHCALESRASETVQDAVTKHSEFLGEGEVHE